jgi:hypothetical protein
VTKRGPLATAADVVDPATAVACTPALSSRVALGTTTVHCTAADAAGNVAHGAFDVTVGDTTAPVLQLPDSFAVGATSPAARSSATR